MTTALQNCLCFQNQAAKPNDNFTKSRPQIIIMSQNVLIIYAYIYAYYAYAYAYIYIYIFPQLIQSPHGRFCSERPFTS